MDERLVDVLNHNDTVLHTFPISIKAAFPASSDAAFEEKALCASAHAQLVPTDELETLSSRMHVGRGGPVTPYGDTNDILMETKTDLDRIVREKAYQIWEQEGRPDGRADKHWRRAQRQRLCQRAYRLWEQEGRPEGQADRHWNLTRAFEAN